MYAIDCWASRANNRYIWIHAGPAHVESKHQNDAQRRSNQPHRPRHIRHGWSVDPGRRLPSPVGVLALPSMVRSHGVSMVQLLTDNGGCPFHPPSPIQKTPSLLSSPPASFLHRHILTNHDNFTPHLDLRSNPPRQRISLLLPLQHRRQSLLLHRAPNLQRHHRCHALAQRPRALLLPDGPDDG